MTTCAIVGWRNMSDYDYFCKVVDQYYIGSMPHFDAIVSGGAPGADTLAEQYAKQHAISIIVFNANWEQFGRAAGPLRNKQIVEFADMMIAFLAEGSKGTANSISLAKSKGIPVFIYPSQKL